MHRQLITYILLVCLGVGLFPQKAWAECADYDTECQTGIETYCWRDWTDNGKIVCEASVAGTVVTAAAIATAYIASHWDDVKKGFKDATNALAEAGKFLLDLVADFLRWLCPWCGGGSSNPSPEQIQEARDAVEHNQEVLDEVEKIKKELEELREQLEQERGQSLERLDEAVDECQSESSDYEGEYVDTPVDLNISCDTAETNHSSATGGLNEEVTEGWFDDLETPSEYTPPDGAGSADSSDEYLFLTPEEVRGYYNLVEANRHLNAVRESLDPNDLNHLQKQAMLDLAEALIQTADQQYANNQANEGDKTISTASRIIDGVLDFVPGLSFCKDVYSLATGFNPITGEELSSTERAILAGGIFLPSVAGAGLKRIAKTAKLMREMFKKTDNIIFKNIDDIIKKADNELVHLSKIAPDADEAGKVVDDVLERLPAGNSKKLGKNMEAAGIIRPPETAAHHITAGNHPRALETREHLRQLGLKDVDDYRNGVFLPQTRTSPAPGAYHPSLHTYEYIDNVNEEVLQSTTLDEAWEILEDIKDRLLDDDFPH